ncbi:MAG: YqeG family HAD IIIA-type phosphatase [Clostridia bacterium]|nr:YqeG family HAD IIIA-type phosphatase [Clostridia bacterium]
MRISKRFFPDYKFSSISYIDINILKNRGIKFAILDIDNTLVPYTSPKPDDNALNFLNKLKENGIKYCFVSNNHGGRINLFNEEIGAPVYPNAAKPLLLGIRKAMKAFGANKKNTVIIGDQVFTDVWGGKRAGILTILVDPIKECNTAFFRFKRHFERIIVNDFELNQRENKK